MSVKIFTLSNCPWSKKLKEWLKKNKISYEEVDLLESETARDEVIEKTGQMCVPVIVADNKYLIGFNEEKLTAALGKIEKGKK